MSDASEYEHQMMHAVPRRVRLDRTIVVRGRRYRPGEVVDFTEPHEGVEPVTGSAPAVIEAEIQPARRRSKEQ